MEQLPQTIQEILSHEVVYSYSRSSGPGGQKVNKTETQAELRWNLENSKAFSLAQKDRIRLKLSNRTNKAGEIHLQSDQFRSRLRNQEDCWQRFIALLAQGLTVPKARKKTKLPFSAVRKRREAKQKQSEKKRNRKIV